MSRAAREAGDESTPRSRLRFPGVRAPKPLLSPETERGLTARQLEVLDELEGIVALGGLADLTMAEIAAELNCSLRTLYGIAPSKEALVLAVVDRRLRRIGRAAIATLEASMSPLEALRAYLQATSEAVQPSTEAFGRELAGIVDAERLLDGHERYVMAVTRSLLDRAVAAAEIGAVDTSALAHLLGGLGREFARPEIAKQVARPPKATADALVEIILRGLRRN
ncbi:MAG: TetR/AcrR family transcriptional regulator [Myxococcota bacterium]